jgi:hypothetical protein
MKTDNSTYVNKIELYMEGIKIPTFSSIQISEALNSTPASVITFLNTVDVLKLLPGTIVQIFVNRKVYTNIGEEKYGGEGKTILLFEGEIVTISFAYSPMGNTVSIKAVPVIAKMLKARMRPNHVLLKQDQRDAESMNNSKFNLSVIQETPGNKKINTSQDTTEVLKDHFERTNDEIGKDFTDPKKAAEKKYSGKISDIYKENDIEVFSTYIAQELNSKSATGGDYNKLLQRFNFQFEKFDLYYGLCSGSFKIGPSLYALKNLKDSNKLAYLIFQKAFADFLKASSQKATDAGEAYNLIDVFNLLQQAISYKAIIFASPLSIITKHIDSDNGDFKPVRMLFMPDLDSGPPINCNIWFPNQISSASFERDLVNEPTRLIGIMDYTQVTGMDAMPEFLNPIFVAPDLDITTTTGQIKNKKVADLSFEECYRGITLRESTYSGAVLKTLQNIATGSEKKDHLDIGASKAWSDFQKMSETDKKKSVDEVLKSFTLQEYNKLKYGQRMLNMTVEWSPYRTIGLPGGVILENGLNIVGTVQSINTVIASDGKIGSNVLLSYVRCVYDNDFTDDTDYKDVIGSLGGYDTPDSYRFIDDSVPDFSRESILGSNPYAFQQEIWGFDNIGKKVYSEIINGIQSDNYDGSILEYFDNSTIESLSKMENNIIKSNYQEFSNYVKLKLSFRKLRDSYYKNDDKQSFVEGINRRSVLTKKEYEDYLGFEFDYVESGNVLYTKDTFKILRTQGRTDLTQTEILQGANIKASVFNTVKELKDQNEVFSKYTNLNQAIFTEFDTLNAVHNRGEDDIKSLYKLYDIHRQAHVRNLLTKLNREQEDGSSS